MAIQYIQRLKRHRKEKQIIMSVTSGFFNSVNSDRRYNAEQMSAIFNNLITDGVFMSIGNRLMVTKKTGLTVAVGIGRAWFNSTWTYNDAELPITATASHLIYDRIDAIVLEVNSTNDIRANSIKLISGVAASTPVRPAMIKTGTVHQYPLSYILVRGNATEIIQADITNMVGTSECPFVTGILSTMNIDSLVAQWSSDWNNWKTVNNNDWTTWKDGKNANFEAWFNTFKNQIGTDLGASLQSQINSIQKYETASGTGNAITLLNVYTTEGAAKAFKAVSDNNGAATTINGKQVYDESTNGPPNLKAGKYYVAVYNLAKDCFYVSSYDANDEITQTGAVLHNEDAPDGTVDITEIKGETYQLVTSQGKNILSPKYMHPLFRTGGSDSGLTLSVRSDKSVAVTGNTTGTVTLMGTDISSQLTVGTTYVLSGNLLTLRIKKTDNSVAYSTIFTYATNMSEVAPYFQVVGANTVDTIVYPMIRVSTSTIEYEPFVPNSPTPDYPALITSAGDTPFDVVAYGKNLLPNGDFSNGLTGWQGNLSSPTITSSNLPSGFSNGLMVDVAVAFRGVFRYYTLFPGKYTLSALVRSSVNNITFSFGVQDISISTFTINTNWQRINWSFRVDTRKYAPLIFYPNQICTMYMTGVQLELSPEATTYEPYVENKATISQKLGSLPNGVKNTIEKGSDGKTRYIQRISTDVFDGSADEVWYYNIYWETANTRAFYTFTDKACGVTNLISNMFKTSTSGNLDIESVFGEPTNNVIYIRLNKNRPVNDLSSFKAWLTTNPVTFQYELATPIETIIPDISLTSYKPITNVFTTANPQLTITGVFRNKKLSLTDLGITATATELNYMDGVTGPVQDQLDSKMITRYAGANIDLNTFTASGCYRIDSGCINKPSNSPDYGIVFVASVPSADTLFQIYTSINSGAMWTRTGKSNPTTWTPWRIVALSVSDTNDDLTTGDIELYGALPLIDFHFNNSAVDFTSRIIEIASGVLEMQAQIYINKNGRAQEHDRTSLQLRTADNTPPGIAFHRVGYSAVNLFENGANLYTRRNGQTTDQKVMLSDDFIAQTTDLTPGVSALATGKVCYVYE